MLPTTSTFRLFLFVSSFLFVLIGCQDREEASTKATLFRLLPSSRTGVQFTNTIIESDSLNILRQANLYNGGGVGIGDFNNDGLPDMYFAGNMVSNKLYLNTPEADDSLKFTDVTEVAGVGGDGRWCTGVSVVDINADGLPDMYVSASFREDPLLRTNLLYINQGNNEQDIPVFKESAEAYGLADTGFSTQGVFFDYDRDGDLDMYLVTNELNDPKTPIRYRPKVTNGSAVNTDRLYRNNGDQTFTDISEAAGIQIEGWGHAVAVSDFNLDGWPDLYISNDFISNDLLYINNRDGFGRQSAGRHPAGRQSAGRHPAGRHPAGRQSAGRHPAGRHPAGRHPAFSNQLAGYFKHTAWNAMGTEAVDINNDGFVDLISLEMLPENNLRKKTMLGGNEYFNYFNNRKYDYEHQYVRNVLQLNSGMTPEGHPVFSEIAMMAGVFQTDWSWTPLLADFDNDGFRDMVITNGLPRDVTDLDYIVYENGQDNYGGSVNATLAMVEEYFPVVKISNYAFKNTGGFMFADSTDNWGLNKPSFSNGGVYADLDNDGDLDLVVNNINDEAFVYENTLNNAATGNKQHYLTVAFKGDQENTEGIGASVRLYYAGNKQQYYEHQPTRGYLSSVDDRAHFGLGGAAHIDSLRVRWPDGKSQLITTPATDQTLTLLHKDASEFDKNALPDTELPLYIEDPTSGNTLLTNVALQHGINFTHQERDAIDYNIQRTLPHKLSQYGPGIAVGDVDGNGYDDFYVGGAAGKTGVFFMQNARGNFTEDTTRIADTQQAAYEDMGVLLFDADHDDDLDLYVVSGSYEFPPDHPINQDRLYLNDGRGKFELDETALPELYTNGSCVRAADYDQDGDLDLFVGGRSVSGAYPAAPQSYILENQDGKFVDVTQQKCPSLQTLGMISDALWSDFDQDGQVDLVLAGEWLPITFYKNTGDAFVSANETSGISKHVGWWNSLVSGDFDQDGDIDYAAGNLGLNSAFKATPEEPMTILAKDLDDNGKIDPMVFCYIKAEDGTRQPFPMHTRDDMISQLIAIRKRYPTFKSFGQATMDSLWSTQDREGAIMLQANDLHSSYIENKGNGKFSIRPLPLEAQIAPVYGMVSKDMDDDGKPDLLLVGNDYGIEPISGRHDAFNGLCLKGDGKGNFVPLTIAESGFFVKGDAKGLALVQDANGKDLLVATQNQDSLLVFSRGKQEAKDSRLIKLEPDDFYAEIVYKDGSKQRIEFYYGATYLSQSSRKITVSQDVAEMMITDFKGDKRDGLR